MLTSTSPYLHVSNRNYSPSIASYSTNVHAVAGAVRYCDGRLFAYDGSSWHTVDCQDTISTSSVLDTVVTWVLDKMAEETRLTELAKTNPSVQNALNSVNQAKEQLDVVVRLVS